MDHDFGEMTEAQLSDIIAGEDQSQRGYALMEMAWRMRQVRDFVQEGSYAAAARDVFHAQELPLDEGMAALIENRSMRTQEKYEAGLAAADVAIAIFREYGRERQLGDALAARAACLKELDRAIDAEISYFDAANMLIEAESFTGAGISLLDAGEIQGLTDRIGESLATFQRALKVFTDGSDLVGVGRAHDRVAAALIEMGQLDDALIHLREALNLFEYVENEFYRVHAKYRLGWTLVSRGDTEEAIPLLADAAAHYKRIGDFGKAAECDFQIAHALSATGRFAEAEDLYRKTRAVFAGAGRESDARLAEGNLAINLGRQGRHAEAVDVYRKVIAQAHEADDAFGYRGLITRMANDLRFLDTFDAVEEAIATLDLSPIDDWGDHAFERVLQLDSYRAAHAWLGHDDEAEKYAKAILDFPVESSYLFHVAGAHRTLGHIAEKRGDIAEADRLIAQAIALYLADGEDDTARELSQRFLIPGGTVASEVLRREGDSPSPQADPVTGEIKVIPPIAESE
jgi:tetratricopeptide (TPR) repeat protein